MVYRVHSECLISPQRDALLSNLSLIPSIEQLQVPFESALCEDYVPIRTRSVASASQSSPFLYRTSSKGAPKTMLFCASTDQHA